MKILYLEDNSTDADLTIRKLTQVFPECKINHTVTLFEARKILKKESTFDLALIDMHIPDGNGLELLADLREKHFLCAIIVLTGSGDEESAVAALKAGADDYLTKKTGYLEHLPSAINLAIKNCNDKLKIANQNIAILYVEHNKSDIELTKRHFSTYAPNFKITSVTSGEEALSKLPLTPEEPCNYSVILLDYKLIGINALEFVKIVRQERKLRLAIVVVTGQGTEEIAIEALRLGVDEYLVKRPNYLFRLPSLLTSAFQHHQLANNQIALEKSEALYKLLVNNSSDVIFILDLDLKYTFVSPAVFHLRGYTPDEAIKQSISDVVTPDSMILVKKNFEYALENGRVVGHSFDEPMVMELEMIRKNGTKVWTEVKASLMFDEDGNKKGIFGVTRDLSIRKKAEMDLIEAKEKAEESDQLKTAFLNNISHEIRTPMNAIIGFTDFLNDPDLDAESRLHFTNVISRSSNQLLSIVSDIISIATIESGQEKYYDNEVNINSICKLIHDQYNAEFIEKDILFQCNTNLSDSEAEIRSDETKLMQILSNLVSNALKFTKKGQVNFGYTVLENELEFYIQDTGIGISPAMSEVIFDRFRQVENTTTREYGGSGLGLSISKAYVNLLGGKIWLTSELNQGSTFYFTIPYQNIKTIKNDTHAAANETNAKSEGKKVILVAEDEEDNFDFLEVLLRKNNFEVLWAKDGTKAVEICKINPNISMVLMDIKMPVMNGYEATKEIRKFNKDIVIIAQTAYALQGDREKSLAAGCNDYISKPIRQSSFLELINKHT